MNLPSELATGPEINVSPRPFVNSLSQLSVEGLPIFTSVGKNLSSEFAEKN
jgi:hypothetical protein